MSEKMDAVIIGAGSAGLSALRQVKNNTENYVMINTGGLGTTCASTGCMPSKVLIHTANEFHSRLCMKEKGVFGGENLRCDIPEVMKHVRSLRDRFSGGMTKVTKLMAGDKLINERAEILSPESVRAGDTVYETERIIIAAGSSPVIPREWKGFSDRILTSRNIFEQEDLPERIAVIGLGPIGLELGQALSRLGIQVSGFDMLSEIGGITDPEVNDAAISEIQKEFPLHLGEGAEITEEGEGLRVSTGSESCIVDKIVAAMGVRPNLSGLGLENLGIDLNKRGLPEYDGRTTQIGDLPVFIAGDVNGCRAVLHEALDEGLIAGRNSFSEEPDAFCRRTPLKIVFSSPQISSAGRTFRELSKEEVITGKSDFSDQSRAVIEGRNTGVLRIYADKESGRILGSEMAVPEAEHLGHIISLAVENGMTLGDMLHMPFYHPTVEEGLRSALRDAAKKFRDFSKSDELSLCSSSPESPVC